MATMKEREREREVGAEVERVGKQTAVKWPYCQLRVASGGIVIALTRFGHSGATAANQWARRRCHQNSNQEASSETVFVASTPPGVSLFTLRILMERMKKYHENTTYLCNF